MLTPENVKVRTLGVRKVKSPLNLSTTPGDFLGNFVPDETAVRYKVEFKPGEPDSDVFFEKAGPREFIYFNPSQTRAAIVTCGGLCPGLNNVVRSVFLSLYFNYGVKDVLGIRYGYQGFDPMSMHPPIQITPEYVENIHQQGGTILGSSRGPVDPRIMVNTLQRLGVNVLFCVGGDGTQRGALAISTEAQARNHTLAVVGIPKTIDNDVPYVWRSFGFSTAREKAKDIIDSAHNEARGAPNGISLVKVMGRNAGFIAAGATLASQEVNFVLIPEVEFALDGENGFLNLLKRRIQSRHHAVIVVAEGAGQHLFTAASEVRDPSGNVKHADIGVFLKSKITEFFTAENIPVNLKYFDPSYYIRSVPANCDDSLFCDQLARQAVHAGMAGKTEVLIGSWYNILTHVPIPLVCSEKKRILPESEFWTSVLAVTGQPAVMK